MRYYLITSNNEFYIYHSSIYYPNFNYRELSYDDWIALCYIATPIHVLPNFPNYLKINADKDNVL